MLELGMVVEFGLGLAALLWYREAAGPYSERIVGYDFSRRPSDLRSWWRDGPTPARRVLAAWRIPSPDPDTEHLRVLMRRRFQLFVALAASSFVLPALFGLIGVDWEILSRGGVAGLVPLGMLVALLALSIFDVGRPLVAYGFGEPLDWRKLLVGVARLVVTSGVAIGIVLIAAR